MEILPYRDITMLVSFLSEAVPFIQKLKAAKQTNPLFSSQFDILIVRVPETDWWVGGWVHVCPAYNGQQLFAISLCLTSIVCFRVGEGPCPLPPHTH